MYDPTLHTVLPGFISPKVIHQVNISCLHYLDLQRSFTTPTSFKETLDKHASAFRQDNLFEFAKSCFPACVKVSIERFSRLFCRATLEQCCVFTCGVYNDKTKRIVMDAVKVMPLVREESEGVLVFMEEEEEELKYTVEDVEMMNAALLERLRDLSVVNCEAIKTANMGHGKKRYENMGMFGDVGDSIYV